MTAVTAAGETELDGIRPVRLPHDLMQLADLLETAFGDELRMTGSYMVQDMRQAARLGTLLWLTGGSRLGGFVYTEGGLLVGNVTLTQDTRDAYSWFICNVAVLPEFRGRGIAGRLMDHALAYIRRMRGRWVRLQVRPDNLEAYGMYKRRGFHTYDTTSELRRDAPQTNTNRFERQPLSDNRVLRPIRPRDSRALWYLVIETSPQLLLTRRLYRPADFRRGWLEMLDNQLEHLLGGKWRDELVGYDGRRLAAYGALWSDSDRSPYTCELRVLPGQRGHWEQALTGRLLERLRGKPHRPVLASVSLTHPEALDALRAYGFVQQRSLAHMSLELDS